MHVFGLVAADKNSSCIAQSLCLLLSEKLYSIVYVRTHFFDFGGFCCLGWRFVAF